MVQFVQLLRLIWQKKENIQGRDAGSLGSVSSTMEEKMLCVFNFTAVTELILNYNFAKQSIV